ncbi:MAG TPA: hypothetical protein VKR06_30820 [Ktedonosporobacter sp.]|nr:hypothetical protein [Ktedonosporobacter sp.]
MSKYKEVPPLEMIGDLIYSPTTDLPFGKNIRIGLSEFTIYMTAIEKGYHMGVQAHKDFLAQNHLTAPVMLDDTQFTMIMNGLLPKNLVPFEKRLWRSYFIVGWTCVYLGTDEETTPTND